MKITQRFRVRKDLRDYVVYFEEEGPMEMPRVSAFIIEQLSKGKVRGELMSLVEGRFPRLNAKQEVDEVLKTLRRFKLLSS